MNWTDQLFLSNPVAQWLWSIGFIIAFVLLNNRISNSVASLLFIPIRRQWKTLEKSSFTDLILQPLSVFIFLLIAIPSLENLKFPEILNLTLNNISIKELMHRGSRVLMIISCTWIFLRFMDFIALLLDHHARANKDKRDDQMIVFLRDFIKVLLYIASFLLVLKIGFHVNVGAILTGLSIVGAALALAAKESIENLIASFIIFFDKPFFTGDQVKVSHSSGAQGIIEHIGLRSTRIRTPDQTLITVPNKQMVDSVVDNWSMRTARRAEWKLDLDLQNPSTAVQYFLDDLSKYISTHAQVKQHTIWISDISKSQLSIQLDCLTEAVSLEIFQQIRQDVNWSIKLYLEQHAIKTASDAK
jgi:MscS family membrane protein